jgi:hypothetical protein
VTPSAKILSTIPRTSTILREDCYLLFLLCLDLKSGPQMYDRRTFKLEQTFSEMYVCLKHHLIVTR